MKCSNCTTELWGRPAVCPVCGTPTGLNRRSTRQSPPPWSTSPAAPPPAPPTRSAPLAQPFFNASDLLEPDALDAVPQAPGNIGIFSTGPLDDKEPAAEAPAGTLNAADLFDPEVLADLTGGREEGGSYQDREDEEPEEDFPAFLREGPQGSYQDKRDDHRQGPPRPSTGPISAPRAASGSIAPPLFSLSALPTAEPEPIAPPLPPPPPFPLREPAMPGPPMPRPEGPGRQQPPRGYRGPSGPLPVSAPPIRPSGPPPGMYPPGAYPTMPAPPRGTVRPQQAPARGRRFFSTLGGLLSLVLVLAIIGIALLFGAAKIFQLQSFIVTPTPAPTAPLPTVAPKDGYTILPDKAIGFSLQFPTNWEQRHITNTEDSGYRGDLYRAGPYTGFEVGTSSHYTSWSPAQIDDYMLTHWFEDGQMTNIHTFASATPTVRIANQDWTAEDANMTIDGVAVRMTSLAIIHNGQGYAIFYFAPQDAFSNNYSAYFEPMLLSFRFLNN